MNVATSLPALSRPPVGSVVQAVAVLRFLGSRQDGAGVTAIARALGIGPSSCFNVLRTLVAEDMVAFDPVTKSYTLGLGTIDLARRALRRDAVVQAAEGPMAALADAHDAAIGLWRLAPRDRLVLAALAESEAATRIHMVVGQRQPAAAGATGRAMLATRRLDDGAIAAAFADLRWQNAPSLADYRAEIRATEARGFAVDVDQINRGIATVAAAIPDESGVARFVLSASMFAGRDAAALDLIGARVHETAQALGRAISRAA
ncbi:IclR family transcriptional regulator [Sphingomonas immobilis]|uniref:IclR family transcriptional regulator C-terminal domain-containing protein n=1 Tax=Sphingomonas immobilis TaxID=3063997 RepID=A0ABT8ZWY4_9SPHN|nr:helix-turn-helix domain-containing protein [Sphingomonas sp. CA1-15]MDO7842097.1 IclR family transcriptional regulator C-terminal domain-containing protein [Sphingomonas sp. CA1-15]